MGSKHRPAIVIARAEDNVRRPMPPSSKQCAAVTSRCGLITEALQRNRGAGKGHEQLPDGLVWSYRRPCLRDCVARERMRVSAPATDRRGSNTCLDVLSAVDRFNKSRGFAAARRSAVQ